ncbi:MAG: hypothetical protein ABEL76_14185 [Bradymonadaceae bacterium]
MDGSRVTCAAARVGIALILSTAIAAPGTALARDGGEETADQPSASISARVDVRHGAEDRPVEDATVLLRAARPKGPFEKGLPKARKTWSASTDADGVATFESLPSELASSGLELTAVVEYGGISFRSSSAPMADGARLSVDVYDKTPRAKGVRVRRLRTVVEPWEDYLVFTQFWYLQAPENRAVDTTLIENESGQTGLPIEFPTDAEGIEASGSGDTKVIDGTLYWKGTLTPNRTRRLRVRFSMSAKRSSFVYRQTVDYPTDEVEVALPIETNYEKHPRLNDASLAAKGFETVEYTTQIRGLKRGVEYLYASGRSLEAGESFAFKVDGLPFGRPKGPWIALILGLLGAAGVAVYGFSGPVETEEESRADAEQQLRDEHDRLLDELADLERARERGELGDIDYEVESLRLRERLALVKEKLDELEADAAGA